MTLFSEKGIVSPEFSGQVRGLAVVRSGPADCKKAPVIVKVSKLTGGADGARPEWR